MSKLVSAPTSTLA